MNEAIARRRREIGVLKPYALCDRGTLGGGP
jgi:hypothetical protein